MCELSELSELSVATSESAGMQILRFDVTLRFARKSSG